MQQCSLPSNMKERPSHLPHRDIEISQPTGYLGQATFGTHSWFFCQNLLRQLLFDTYCNPATVFRDCVVIPIRLWLGPFPVFHLFKPVPVVDGNRTEVIQVVQSVQHSFLAAWGHPTKGAKPHRGWHPFLPAWLKFPHPKHPPIIRVEATPVDGVLHRESGHHASAEALMQQTTPVLKHKCTTWFKQPPPYTSTNACLKSRPGTWIRFSTGVWCAKSFRGWVLAGNMCAHHVLSTHSSWLTMCLMCMFAKPLAPWNKPCTLQLACTFSPVA